MANANVNTAEAPDPRPELVHRSVVVIAYIAIIVAASASLSMNIDHDTSSRITLPDGMSIPAIPGIIAVIAGIMAPFGCAVLAHMATMMNFHISAKIGVGIVTLAMMYVSASAGTKVLTPAMGFWPALAWSLATDATAMICLTILMIARDRRTALTEWLGREAGRQEAARRAEIADKYGLGNGGGRARGTGGGTGRGNDGGNGTGGEAGNDPDDQAPDADADDELAKRRRQRSDEEMLTAARTMADELAVIGEELTVAKFRNLHGGQNKRIAAVVARVKAERAAAAVAADGGVR